MALLTMKYYIIVTITVVTFLLGCEGFSVPQSANPVSQKPVIFEDKKPCKCMNWRNCDGTVDNSVECHPNYVMVCCIQPDPEPIPQPKFDASPIEDIIVQMIR